MTIKEIEKEYPQFAKEMNGCSVECTLRFFYKKDKESGIYEFIDVDCEEEVAELLGVPVMEFAEDEEVDSDGELIQSGALNQEQLNMILPKDRYNNDK
jgi:diphthamide synthase (EF-2-diphthine--ammonia ligase)